MLPPRIKKPRRESRLRCPGHLAWIRKHQCSIGGCGGRPIEAAHVRTGTDGGTGIKPSDRWTISLCADHHRLQHQLGEPEFERRFSIDMKALAREFTAKSPHRAKLQAATVERVR